MKSWRNLPPVLLAMFAIEILGLVGFLTYDLSHSPADSSVRISLAESGLTFTTHVLGLVGFLELSRRATGRLSLGFKIAALGLALGLADQIWWHIFQFVMPHWSFETITTLQGWTYFTVKLVPLLGVTIAATVSDRRAALAGVVALLVSDPVPWLARHTYGWMLTSWRGQYVLLETLHAIGLVALFAISTRLATPGIAAPASAGTYGLRTIASGLWLRVIAACTVTGLTLLLVLGKTDAGAVGVLKLAMISSAIASVISLAMIARGASGAMVADMPATPLVIAAAASLWCLGVALAQLPFMYRMLYGHDYGYGSGAYDYVATDSLATGFIVLAAIGAVARAITGFATRRGIEQLRFEAQTKGVWAVVLMFASLGLQQWLLPDASSVGALTLMMLGAAVCSLWGTVLMARLCALAADSLQAEPGLPTATLHP